VLIDDSLARRMYHHRPEFRLTIKAKEDFRDNELNVAICSPGDGNVQLEYHNDIWRFSVFELSGRTKKRDLLNQ